MGSQVFANVGDIVCRRGCNWDRFCYCIPAFQQQDVPVEPFQAMSHSEALYYARHFMQLPWSANHLSTQVDSSTFRVHGLKTTLLSWAAQTNLSEEDRRVHGDRCDLPGLASCHTGNSLSSMLQGPCNRLPQHWLQRNGIRCIYLIRYWFIVIQQFRISGRDPIIQSSKNSSTRRHRSSRWGHCWIAS